MTAPIQSIKTLLKELRLTAIYDVYQDWAKEAVEEDISHEAYLYRLLQRECEERFARKILRLQRISNLSGDKTFATFDLNRLPTNILKTVKIIREGHFLENHENILIFGNPGSGKTHLMSAIAHEQISNGRSIRNFACTTLVQELLKAKRDLDLNFLLKRYSKLDGIMIDDIGYVQQSQQEMEVLFTLLADRYERGSVMVTSNLPFSQWEKIFKDKVMAVAAVDRLVHHSIIIELNLPSYRIYKAKEKKYEK